jgi:F-type H+-transporting ATPase subunit b
MEELLQNTNFWVAVSFTVFVLGTIKFAGKKITGALDAKIASIKSEIETAEKLKADTEALLADYQAKQRDAEIEAQRIIEDAKSAALGIQQMAEADLAEAMTRREAQLTERLKMLEEQTIADIQNHAAELALQATREIVVNTMDQKSGDRLIDQAIASVAKHLN